MLCSSQPLSASILSDHRKKERKEMLIRCLLQLRHCVRLAHIMHIRIWDKALCSAFPRGGYETQRGKLFSPGHMTFIIELLCKTRLQSPSSFCAAQRRYDVGTQSQIVPSDTCLSLFHSYQCALLHESVSFGFSWLFIIQWHKFRKHTIKYWLSKEVALGVLTSNDII